ncbi:MAG TPA: hypothetical protein PKE47_11045, partial [Verrucomicrobiota bacterium]|nr:hypothetical protein [Verrucomicrobiota bacterium]
IADCLAPGYIFQGQLLRPPLGVNRPESEPGPAAPVAAGPATVEAAGPEPALPPSTEAAPPAEVSAAGSAAAP